MCTWIQRIILMHSKVFSCWTECDNVFKNRSNTHTLKTLLPIVCSLEYLLDRQRIFDTIRIIDKNDANAKCRNGVHLPPDSASSTIRPTLRTIRYSQFHTEFSWHVTICSEHFPNRNNLTNHKCSNNVTYESWVRCGTWWYRFLIFAPLLTYI